MIADGLVPGGAPIPETADDLSRLTFTNALWDKCDQLRVQLAPFLRSECDEVFDWFSETDCPLCGKGEDDSKDSGDLLRAESD
jgi:hypothetical protein